MSKNSRDNNNTYSTLILISVACLTSLNIQAAPPEPYVAPVTVENTTDNPVPVIVQNPGTQAINYQFVGISSNELPASGGVMTLNQACQIDYENPLARMCDTQEFFDSPHVGTTTGNAWIWPHVITTYYSPIFNSVEHTIYPDFTVRGALASVATCNTWRTQDGGVKGLIALTSTPGEPRITQVQCSVQSKVACCAPR